jgi:LacI family transcriptional regulator
VATIKEVAKKARVSVGTVSNVLSGAVPVSKRLRERVLEVIKQLDYHPNQVARSLKVRQTKTLGLVISDITNPFVPHVIRGAEDAAWREKYMLITFNSDDQLEREQQVLEALRGRRVDGVLLMAVSGSDHSHIRSLLDSGIPVVCVDRELPDLATDCVVADHFGGARACVAHFALLGHRRIAMLSGDLGAESARQRFAGYKQALQDANIPSDESLVISTGFRVADGYEAGRKLLERTMLPTAVFASNAPIALGFLKALREANMRCPEDLALATFDDPVFAESLRPALTAVAQPAFDVGFKAVELLLRRIADPKLQPARVVLETTVNIRESSGSLRAGA